MIDLVNFLPILHADKEAKIIITTHHKPDADAMGSSLGLYNYLLTRNFNNVQVITPTDYGKFLTWMPGNEQVLIYEDNRKKCTALIHEAQYIFCLDFNSLARINEMGPLVQHSLAVKILIDHHQQPEDFAQYGVSRTTACSTAELIYDFISLDDGDAFINEAMGACLYAGILTDTGNFRHDTTTSHTHRIVARLADTGFNIPKIHSLLYDQFTLDRTRFIGYCLAHKLEILQPYDIALITVTSEELKLYNITTGDTEGLVNYGLSIEGIKLAVLIIDRTKKVKMSFRGKGEFPCNRFAREYFNGGGHYNAAGGESNLSLEETIQKFKEVIPSYLQYI